MTGKGTPIWKEWVEKIADWVRRWLPWTILLAAWRWFQRRLWFSRRETDKKELEVKHYENKEKARTDNSRKSDRELVDDILSEGAEYEANRHDSEGDG